MKPLDWDRLPEEEMLARARRFTETMSTRRSVRHFSDEPIPEEILHEAIKAASTAPSGANKQPWTFVLVTDPEIKKRIREAAEEEERLFYGGRAPQRWLEDLAPLGTNEDKPFLEVAPALIVVFAQKHGGEAGSRHYYVNESVGIACGFLIAALHHAGLCTLTHTPSPMAFLSSILDRPDHERAYVLMPVGYPSADCEVPDIEKKPLSEVLVRK